MTIFLWSSTFLLALITGSGRWLRNREVIHLFPILSALFSICASTVLTQHALITERILPVSNPIHALPNLSLLYLILHYSLVVWLVLGDLLPPVFRLPVIWPVLFLYSSYLYFRTFFSLEQGNPYPILYALTLGLLLALPRPARSAFFPSSLILSLASFLLLAGAATILAVAPGESANQYLQIACFALLPFLLARDLANERTWRITTAWVVALGGLVFVGLACLKFDLLARNLGVIPALRYRLFIAEVGPNLVSLPLVTVLPVSAAFLLTSIDRRHRLLWGLSTLGILLTVIYTQSDRGFSGWLALVLAIGSMVILLRWPAWESQWRTQTKIRSWLVIAGIGLILALTLLGGWLSFRINTYSFNTRLYIWRTALHQMIEDPFFGSGLTVRYTRTRYADRIIWEEVGPRPQVLIDQPLSQALQKREAVGHAHNLFLELALGAGLPALLAFLWFLWELARHSLRQWRNAGHPSQVLIAGCIAGLMGALGWGLIDVTEFSPPFFTFPAWALIGLLLAAPHTLLNQNADHGSRLTFSSPLPALRSWFSHPRPLVSSIQFSVLGLGIIFVVSIAPGFGNLHYRAAYVAYQERRWAAAADEFLQAARWEPLNAKYQQLRGEALINLSQYDEATLAYERAVHLKRDFAPYHAQLGWLYWLQGDLEQATRHFQRAIEIDPGEVWRAGLHADLGLAYAAQGQIENAIPLFKETIELDPQMALAPYWIPVQRANGKFDVVLDPVYTSEPEEAASLQVRMVAHLGKADYTPRLFALETDTEGLLSFNQILDAIEEDYVAAQAAGSPEAPRLLATLAEAARLAGLSHRAEQTYVMFQEMYPHSAYGFRDLGILFHLQGRWPEAQETLEHAINVSPKDTASWYALAEVYLDQGALKKAEGALDIIYQLSPLEARLYTLRARLYRERGDLVQTSDSLRKSLLIRESIPNRLALADLYRQQGQTQPATDQCLEAAEALLDTWPRPLTPELWEIGACLAQSSGADNLPTEVITLARESPLIGNIVLGHFYRIGGQLDQALAAYQQAAEARPDESAPYFFQGETYQGLGQFDQATTAYRQATQLNPFESLPSLTLGRLQWNQGDYAAALSSFRAATESTPGWDEPYMALGNALWAQGNLKEAGMNYQTAQYLEEATREGMWFDFGGQLASAMIEAPGPDYVRGDYFAIDGRRQRVVFMHPTADAQYVVTIPEGARLAFDLATAPESWTQPGDGVSFIIDVLSSQGVQQLFSTYIDPKHNVLDRRWHTHLINLKDYAGQTITLRFETRAGPTDDNRYDWAGWGEPRLLIP